MPYKVNGKFVSKAVFEEHEAAQAAQTREETEVSENEENYDGDDVTEDESTDKRRGPRATTLFKKAANKKTAAEVKLLKAKSKLSKFDNGRDELLAAVETAEVELEEAAEELETAADNL